jgi:hypothetical protein
MKTYEEWKWLVKGSLILPGTIEQQDVAAGEIAQLCLEHPDWGTWHSASVRFGCRCHCANCSS